MLSYLFVGTIVFSRTPTDLAIFNGVLGVKAENGTIAVCRQVDQNNVEDEIQQLKAQHGDIGQIIRIPRNGFLIPGFVDTHIHAPQYVFTGTGYDLDLLGWLSKYTFPREAGFKDRQYAQTAYSKVVRRLLKNGTTTACYYGTIYTETNIVLMDEMLRQGQRGFVGKVNMDRNSPDFYVEKTQESLEQTETFIAYWRKLPQPSQNLVRPCITPRFAPTCSTPLMKGLAEIAKRHQLPIQTHISESCSECSWVLSLFPDMKSYTDVYDQHGLLNDNTILAHAIHLSTEERKRIAESGAGISHCPTSNFALTSGIMNVRQAFEDGITKVGLGTDVSGGYSPSMLTSIRDAMTSSKILALPQPNTVTTSAPAKNQQALTLPECLWLATMGGAKVMNLDHRIGNFDVGKEFDAILVDIDASGVIDVFPHDTIEDVVEKWVYLGDDRCTKSVFVAGKPVYDK